MKDALTGLVRAIAILFAVLLIFNFARPLLMGSNGNVQKNTNDDYSDGSGTESTTSTSTIKYDDNYNYEKLYNVFKYNNVAENFGSEFLGNYYQGKKLDNTFFLYLSIINLTKNRFVLICNDNIELPEEDVTKKVTELFGNVDFKNESYTTKDKNLIISYDAENKKYTVENKMCSGIKNQDEFIETTFLGGTTKDEIITIYETAHLVKNIEKDGLLTVENYKGVTETSGRVTDTKSYFKYKYEFENTGESVILKKISRVTQ